MTEHPQKAYELLQWLSDTPHSDGVKIVNSKLEGGILREQIPEHLRLWLSYLVHEGLIHAGATALTSGRYWLADLGRLALEMRADRLVGSSELSADEKSTGLKWEEAARRMEQLRLQGERFTSQHKLSQQFGCSSGTINKAIRNTQSLQAWAKPDAAAPRAQSINDLVTDRTAQSREADPEDDAAIREFIEGADPETKAWFLALTRDSQLAFLDDPDQHDRILGRKP